MAQPVELFRVQGLGEDRSPIEAAAPAGLTPLTGRDHEISLLKDRWEQAQEGMGQVVLLIGEPGLGKSRLVYTLKEHVLGQIGRRARWTRPSSSGAARRTSRTRGCTRPSTSSSGPSASAARSRRRPGSTGCSTTWSSTTWPGRRPCRCGRRCCPCRPRTAFPPLSLSPARQREETFRAMLEWLHTRAARRPVLFVVEDLHWVDASTLEFLGQFLAEGLHDRILTVLTFRPEFQTPWPAVAHQTSLALNRLTRRQVGDLMRKKAGARLPEALVEQIYDRTGGVPLFVEEFTKMVQESGVLDQAGEDGTRAKALLAHEIPATLQDLVMARLDRMEGDREVAQLAAALGREFSYELLAAVATVDEPTLQAELAKLVQAEILYPKGRPPRCTYIFKHALLEDALYNALVKGKRQQFHRRIAEVLEARFPQTVETQPELLAHHFTEAGLTEKAVGYWLKAGLRSRERSADVEAIGHLTKGLALLETLEESRERDDRGSWSSSPRWAPHTSRSAVTPRPRSGRSCSGAANCASGSGMRPSCSGSCWACGSGTSCAAICGCASDLAADGMALAERLNDPGMLMEALFMPASRCFTVRNSRPPTRPAPRPYIPSCSMKSMLCSVARETVVPPIGTGVSHATGVSFPVRPTCGTIFSICVTAPRAAYLYAIAHLGAFPVNPSSRCNAVRSTLMTIPSIS